MAISLVSNPSFSKVLIEICCAAFICGAMIADTKALTLAGLEKRKERIGGLMGQSMGLLTLACNSGIVVYLFYRIPCFANLKLEFASQ